MLKSLTQNKTGILLMIVSAMCVCVGQLFWKLSVDGGIVMLIIGFSLYIVGALVMLAAYRFGSLSVLQPVLSLNYIFSIILANYVLGESITPLKMIGILVITASVILIGGGDD